MLPVIPLLFLHGRGGVPPVVVARPDDRIVRQGEDLVPDGVHYLFHGAVRQIGAAHPLGEKGVAGEYMPRHVQADASGRMARRLDDPELPGADV